MEKGTARLVLGLTAISAAIMVAVVDLIEIVILEIDLPRHVVVLLAVADAILLLIASIVGSAVRKITNWIKGGGSNTSIVVMTMAAVGLLLAVVIKTLNAVADSGTAITAIWQGLIVLGVLFSAVYVNVAWKEKNDRVDGDDNVTDQIVAYTFWGLQRG